MGFTGHTIAVMAAAGAATLSLAYAAMAVTAVVARRRRRPGPQPASPSMSILKPLCGPEPGLEENLRSFCREAGSGSEIIFGARDEADPALAVARTVVAEFPGLDARVVAGAPALGLNAKINTLVHLVALAHHDVIVIADSDTRIGPGYLSSVVAPLLDPSVGIVSCLFRSRPTSSVWSKLGAVGIDEIFIPSVLVSRALRSPAYCSGPMIAMRREVLDLIGGIAVVAPFLADDYELGARVRRLGYRSAVADCEVSVTVNEPTCNALVRHELRWMRTVRTVTPLGHAFSILTYTVPVAVLSSVVAEGAPWSLLLVALALMLRVTLHWCVPPLADGGASHGRRRPPVWLAILREFFSVGIWIASYASRTVVWRGRTMWVASDGMLRISPETHRWVGESLLSGRPTGDAGD